MWLICIFRYGGGTRNLVIEGLPELWLADRMAKAGKETPGEEFPLTLVWARSISDEAAEKLKSLRWGNYPGEDV